jgi:hypothetical protein
LALTFNGLLGAETRPPDPVDDFQGRPRLIVISDIGNEPDDQMSLVRLLLYSNELDIEALIAATSTWQKSAVHPETMRALIQAYGEVRPNLLPHAKGWPTAEELAGRVCAGQPGYGMAATGVGKMSGGAKAIVSSVDRDDARPLWISVWGGVNTLAEALIEVRATRSPAKVATRFPIRTMRGRGSAASFPTCSTSCSHRGPTEADTITPPGPGSAETFSTAMARARTFRR